VFGGEDVKMLCDGDNAGQQGNGLAAPPLGIAAAIPMLVGQADGFSGFFAQADFAGDAGAAVTPQLDHLPVVLMLSNSELEDAAHAPKRCGFGKRLVPERRHRTDRGTGPIEKLDVMLHLPVVAADQHAHARRVAAAADVFKQEGVIEGRALKLR